MDKEKNLQELIIPTWSKQTTGKVRDAIDADRKRTEEREKED